MRLIILYGTLGFHQRLLPSTQRHPTPRPPQLGMAALPAVDKEMEAEATFFTSKCSCQCLTLQLFLLCHNDMGTISSRWCCCKMMQCGEWWPWTAAWLDGQPLCEFEVNLVLSHEDARRAFSFSISWPILTDASLSLSS